MVLFHLALHFQRHTRPSLLLNQILNLKNQMSPVPVVLTSILFLLVMTGIYMNTAINLGKGCVLVIIFFHEVLFCPISKCSLSLSCCQKLDTTIEEYVESTPRISIDGGITLGSKRSTMFLVDLRNGKIVSSRWSADNQQAAEFQGQQDQLALFDIHTQVWAESNPSTIPPVLITRTDYTINHFLNSSKPQWGMTLSVIEASSCQVFRDDLSLLAGYELGMKYDGVMKQCNIMIPVHRIHGIDPLKHGLVSSTRISLPENPKTPVLAASPSNNRVSSHQEHEDNFSGLREMHKLPSADRSLSSLSERQAFNSASEKSDKGNISNGSSLHFNQAAPAVRPDVFHRSFGWFLVPFFLVFVFLYYVKVNYQVKSDKQSGTPDKHSATTKKKKGRKSGNSNGSTTRDGIPSEKDTVAGDLKQDRDELMSFSRVDENFEGRRVGKLFLSNIEIAKGSNGTVVLEGVYDGRPVAVKRLVRAHHDVAFKEIENLIASDQHSNIVRWFGVEYDTDFVYIALERCACSLNDLIRVYSDSSVPTSPYQTEYKISLKGISEDVELWKPDGCPTTQLLKIMRLVEFLSLKKSLFLSYNVIIFVLSSFLSLGACISYGSILEVGE